MRFDVCEVGRLYEAPTSNVLYLIMEANFDINLFFSWKAIFEYFSAVLQKEFVFTNKGESFTD